MKRCAKDKSVTKKKLKNSQCSTSSNYHSNDNIEDQGNTNDEQEAASHKTEEQENDNNDNEDSNKNEKELKTYRMYFTDIFENNEKKGLCTICKQKIKMKDSNTSGLSRHLRNKHENEYLNVTKQKKRQQNTLDTFLNKPKHLATKEEIEDMLIEWTICKYLPFNFYDDEQTRIFFHNMNPNITIPKKDALRDKILLKFHKMQQNIKKYLSTITSKFSFTVDGWTSINNKSFYDITIHFIDGEFNLQSLVLDFVPSHGKHTGKAIADLFFKTVKFYEIEKKIQGITVDNAAANSTFLSELEINLREHNIEFNSTTQHFKCFAHVLHLGVQDALKVLKFENKSIDSDSSDCDSDYSDEDEYENTTCINKLRYILKKIKKSEQLDLKLQSACHSTNCKYLKPMLDVPTRWNSTSDMLERALLMKSALTTLCANNNLLKYNISNDEWLLLNLLSKFLKQFKSVSVLLGGDKYVTLPSVVVAFNILLDKIDSQIARSVLNDSEPDKIFLGALQAAKAKLLKHYHKTNWIYCAVLILDPRHKTETFSMTSWGKEMMNYSILTFKEIFKTKYFTVPEDLCVSTNSSDNSSTDEIDVNILYEKSDITSNNDTIEIDAYLAAKRSDKGEDILKFWNKHQDIYPNLTKMARDFLSTPATSVPSERLFSQAGIVLRKHRNRLNEDSARSILCLKSWLTAKFLTLEK